ncbi:MAG TPA: DinB family protein [Gemmatimonadales bacterium]|jgi:uncharacterized damage-inducible protein DinB
MRAPPRWFDRPWAFELPLSLFPNVVERLRGTAPRLAERVASLPAPILTHRVDGAWSIQENVGHLLDLEPLWLARLKELQAGAPRLMAADLQNQRTHEANHNARDIDQLLSGFGEARTALVAALEAADENLVARVAVHPRLGKPMRLLDHAYFVAEHDDHHLATISALRRRLAPG